MTDSRIKFNALKIIYKQPYPDRDTRITEEYFRDAMCRQLVTSVLAERLRRLSQQKSSPARSAVVVTSEYEPDFFISLFTVTPKNKEQVAECLEFTHREIRRLLEFGISTEEFELAKLATIQRFRLDREINREEIKSEELVKAALEHFLRNHPLISPVELNELRNRIVSGITLESLKDYPAMMFAESEVIYSTCYNNVEEPGIAVSPEQVHSILAKVNGESLEPEFVEQSKLDFTVNTEPGSIVRIRKDKRLGGIEEWQLSNGVRVYYKQSEPVKTNNHLVMTWRFDTGYRSYDENKIGAYRFAAAYNNPTLGFRGMDRTELKNCPELSGLSIMIHSLQQASTIDLLAPRGKEEAAFKTAWLMLTEPYFGKESRLEKAKEDNLKRLARKKSPRELFSEKYDRQVYGNHPWLQPRDSAAVEAVDMAMLEDVWKRAFGDFKGLKVFICSDLDRGLIEDYVCRYVAPLKGEYPYKKTKTAYPKPVLKGYNLITETNAPESEPVSNVNYTFVSGIKTNTRNIVVSDFLDYIVSARYVALIREERGGTYHVGFSTDIPDNPAMPWKGVVNFQTRPEMTELLVGDVKAVMEDMAKNGPTAEEMDLARKYIRKRHGELEHRTSMSVALQEERLVYTALWNRDFDCDYDALLDSIKASDVRNLSRKFLNATKIVMVYTEK